MRSLVDSCAWLAYGLDPRKLTTAARPVLHGNGRLEAQADLDRPCVSEAICFGFGPEGLRLRLENVGVQHLLPAVYDARTGRKYRLSASSTSGARDVAVTIRPDRQVWRFGFGDLTIEVSLILPRLHPGYLFKVDIRPEGNNPSRAWLVDHQFRPFQGASPITGIFGNLLDHDLAGGRIWWESKPGHAEAIGATVDAHSVETGLDTGQATDLMVRLAPGAGEDGQPVVFYCARAFGASLAEARENLDALLADPAGREAETTAWWDDYLGEIPRMETPDETFDRTVLWSWVNFRATRTDVPIGNVPAGLFSAKNPRTRPIICCVDNMEAEAIQLLHDPRPARDTVTNLLRRLKQRGLLGAGFQGDDEGPLSYPMAIGWMCGLVHKYVLSTGDLALLDEDVGGITVLARLEDALAALLAYRDEPTGLIGTDGSSTYLVDPARMLGPSLEGTGRFRDSEHGLLNDSSATTWATLLAIADLEDWAGNGDRAERYRQVADDLGRAIQKHLWREDIGFFGELRADRSFSDYVGMGGFITGLFASHPFRPGGLATPAQAAKLAAWCEHPDFASDLGVISLARSHPYFDPGDFTGFGGGFDMHWCNQVAAGLYAHEQFEEAHRQLAKMWRRLGENAGLGPRYRIEAANSDTGEVLGWRSANYPGTLAALTSVIEGVFGLRWTAEALTAVVHAPWPWAHLRNLRIRGARLDLSLAPDGSLTATVDGREVARGADGRLRLGWSVFVR